MDRSRFDASLACALDAIERIRVVAPRHSKAHAVSELYLNEELDSDSESSNDGSFLLSDTQSAGHGMFEVNCDETGHSTRGQSSSPSRRTMNSEHHHKVRHHKLERENASSHLDINAVAHSQTPNAAKSKSRKRASFNHQMFVLTSPIHRVQSSGSRKLAPESADVSRGTSSMSNATISTQIRSRSATDTSDMTASDAMSILAATLDTAEVDSQVVGTQNGMVVPTMISASDMNDSSNITSPNPGQANTGNQNEPQKSLHDQLSQSDNQIVSNSIAQDNCDVNDNDLHESVGNKVNNGSEDQNTELSKPSESSKLNTSKGRSHRVGSATRSTQVQNVSTSKATKSSVPSQDGISQASGDLLPITDIKIVLGGKRVPANYTKAESLVFSPGTRNYLTDHYYGYGSHSYSGNKSIVICYRRGEPNKKPITALAIVLSNREFVPPGFTVIRKSASGAVADLQVSSATRSYLCVRRGGTSPPITRIALTPNIHELPTGAGYSVLDRSPLGCPVPINANRGQKHTVFLCYQVNTYEVDALCGRRPSSPTGRAIPLSSYPSTKGDNSQFDPSQEPGHEDAHSDAGTSDESDSNICDDKTCAGNSASTGSYLNDTVDEMSHSPQLAALLTHPSALRILYPLLLAIVSRHTTSVIEGLLGLRSLADTEFLKTSQGHLLDPATSGQMTLFDFVIKIITSCTELGVDVFMLPALDALHSALLHCAPDSGLHPSTVHYVCNALFEVESFLRKVQVESLPRMPSRSWSTVSAPARGRSEDDHNHASNADEIGTLGSSSPRTEEIITSPSGIRSQPASSPTTLLGSVALTGRTDSSTSTSNGGEGSGSRTSSGGSSAWVNTLLPASYHDCKLSRQDVSSCRSRITSVLELLVGRGAQTDETDTITNAAVANTSPNTEDYINAQHDSSMSLPQSPPLSCADPTSMNVNSNVDVATNQREHAETSGPMEEVENFIRNQIILGTLLDRVDDFQDSMEVVRQCLRAQTHFEEPNLRFSVEMQRLVFSKLYPKNLHRQNVGLILIWLSKAATKSNGDNLTALDLTHKFLAVAAGTSSEFTDSLVFGYLIRRIVCTAIIPLCHSNSFPVLEAFLGIVSELWKHYRRHLKTELAVILELILLKTLRSRFSSNEVKQLVLESVVSWYDMQPVHLVEMFLNFQNDPPIKHWRILENMVEILCTIGESSLTSETDSKRALQLYALRALVTLMRSLVDASAQVHLMEHDDLLREKSVVKEGEYGWDENMSQTSSPPRKQGPFSVEHGSGDVPLANTGEPTTTVSNSKDVSQDEVDGDQELLNKPRPKLLRSRRSSVRQRHELQQYSTDILSKAVHMVRSEGKDLRKAIRYLIAMNYITESPMQVASLLRINQNEFGLQNVGDYLGEKGSSEAETMFLSQVRAAFVQQMRFAGRTFEDSLRLFLTHGGFRLPKETQQIERLLEAFAQAYYSENMDTFTSADTVLVLAFSVVMLNTDLHNQSVKKKGKMTKEQFLRNLKGLDEGNDLPKQMLESIYDSIRDHEIRISKADDTASASNEEWSNSFQLHGEVAAAAAAAAAAASVAGGQPGSMGSWAGSATAQSSAVDSAGKASNSSVAPGVNLANKTLANNHTSTQLHPHFSHSGRLHLFGDNHNWLASNPQAANELFLAEMADATRQALAILSSQAVICRMHHSKVNADSIRVMFEVVWVQIFGIISTILENPNTASLEMVSHSLDMLRYAISVSLFLGMETERRAFATLLAKLYFVHSTDDSCVAAHGGILAGKHLEQEWYNQVMNATSSDSNVVDVIATVHRLAISMNERVTQRKSYKQLEEVEKRFDSSLKIVNETREFLKEGHLVKKCRRNDRKYTFMLFSDMLVYATTRFGKLRVHQQLPLRTMRVVDLPDRVFVKNAFEIRSPVKTFVVMAPKRKEKVEWIRELTQAIDYVSRQNRVSQVPSPIVTALDTSGSSGTSGGGLDSPRGTSCASSASSTFGDSEIESTQTKPDHGIEQSQEEEKLVGKLDESRTSKIGEGFEKDSSQPFDDSDSAESAFVEFEEDKCAESVVSGNQTNTRSGSLATIGSPSVAITNSRLETNDESVAIKPTKEVDSQVDDKLLTVDTLGDSQTDALFLRGLVFAQPILLDQHSEYQASDEDKLHMYGLFKQATKGDCDREMPPDDEFVLHAKWESWVALKGVSQAKAKQEFLKVLRRVAPSWDQ